MKKILFILILVLVVVSGLYFCPPVKVFVAGYLSPAEPAAPEAVAAPQTPAAEPEPEPAPAVEEPVPEVEPVPEPEPAPLPALNAEAEVLLPKAESGDPVAQFNLARQYVLGEGMAVNPAEFIRWCRIAAEQGLPEAQYTLSKCYEQGLGVEKNDAEAASWAAKAEAAGYAPAN